MKNKRVAKIFFQGMIESYQKLQDIIISLLLLSVICPPVAFLCDLSYRLFGLYGIAVSCPIAMALVVLITGGVLSLLDSFKDKHDEN